MNAVVIVLILLLALLLSFLLSGMESAVLSVSRVRVRHEADDDPRAARLLPLLEDRESLLGAVTVANHVTNVTAFGLIVWKLVKHLGPWGYAAGFLLALPIFIIGLEVLPKTLFRRYPFRSLRRLVPLLSFIALLRAPFRAITRLQALRADEDEEERIASSRTDFRRLLDGLAREKVLPAPSARLMDRVLDFRALTAASVMVPLSKVVAVGPDTPLALAAELAHQHGYHALPVLDDDGRYTGLLNATRLPAAIPPDRQVRQHMIPMEEVPGTLSALATLQRLRRRGTIMALVKDMASEQPLGVVTEEDLLKPLL